MQRYHICEVSALSPFKPLSANSTKHTQTVHQLLSTNFLSVFDHFVGLALKELNHRTITNHFTKSFQKK